MQNKQSPIDFSEQLIKGKIAEMIFSQMFRDSKQFTVIPFGYETTFPEIAQYAYLAEDKQVFETIRNTPDFAIVSHDKREVYLIEVKYRHNLTAQHVLEMAEKIHERWKSVQLFVATPKGFYFGNCSDIILDKGKILPLDTSWISEDSQIEYIKLLMSFIDKPDRI
jgi:Holliday junction resolvase-like predicted endonuclease